MVLQDNVALLFIAKAGDFAVLAGSDEQKVLLFTRAAILFFGLAALVFSILSSDELVLLARVSFAGTSMGGPLILAGIFSRRGPAPK